MGNSANPYTLLDRTVAIRSKVPFELGSGRYPPRRVNTLQGMPNVFFCSILGLLFNRSIACWGGSVLWVVN